MTHPPSVGPASNSLRTRALAACGLVMGIVACGPADDGAMLDSSDDPSGVGQVAQGIVGGTTVTTDENTAVPFISAVKTSGGCSAVKIANNRFLSAAHCRSPNNTSVEITNAIDGVLRTTYTIPAGKSRLHPSFKLGNNAPEGQVSTNVYDVALFDVTSGPSFAATPASGRLIGTGVALTSVGYGLEAGTCPNTGGKKQKGAFTSKADGAGITDRFVHNIIDQSDPSLCGGDSGGPLFLGTGASAVVVGVNSAVSRPAAPNLPLSFFTRLSNVFEWINDPVDSSQSPVPSTLLGDQKSVYLMNGFVSNGKPLLYCAAMTGRNDPVTANGTVATLRSCDGPAGTFSGHSPGWRLLASSAGGFQLVNRNNGLCLGIDPTTPIAQLARVKVQTCAASGNALKAQSWTFSAVSPQNTGTPNTTAYLLKTQLSSSSCLTTRSGGGEVGVELAMISCGATPSETLKWFVTR
jgi:hypothetical protein